MLRRIQPQVPTPELLANTGTPSTNTDVDAAAKNLRSLLDGKQEQTRESERKAGNTSGAGEQNENPVNSQRQRSGRSKDQGGQGHNQQEGDESGATFVLPSAEAILRGMSGSPKIPAVESVPQASPELNAIVQQVADQLQVSAVDGSREVRITLNDSVLPGTEVRLVHEAGKLQVRFVTSSAESLDKLAAHQAVLENTLNHKLTSRDVVVSVQREPQSFDGQHDGRSRGRGDQQPSDEESSAEA